MGLAWIAPAGANPDTPEKEYLLTQPGAGRPSGARLQIGTDWPLPIGPDGVFTGGQMATTGVVTTRKGGGGMTTTGPAIWPQLLIGPAANAVTTGTPTPGKRIEQNLSTARGGAVEIPAGVLVLTADGNPRHGGVFKTNPAYHDIATTLSYQWPASTATLSAGGGPAPAFPAVATFMGPGMGTITYSRASAAGKSFGGPALFALAPGPNAGTHLVPPNATGMLPVATIFVRAVMQFGTEYAALVAASTGGHGRAAQGASLAAPPYTTMFGKVAAAGAPPIRTLDVTMGGACTKWCLGTNGTIRGLPNEQDDLPVVIGTNPPGTAITTWSVGPGFGTLTHNNATSQGFPWTTGFVTVYAPGVLGGETFFAVGSDGRGTGASQGVGNLSLVSGALSTRNLSKADANRGWLSLNLPEPGAALGAAAALGMLALCHALAQRRSG